MRQKTDKKQFVDIVGMYYDIKIIKNNSSEVSDHLLWLFLASSGEFCNSMYFDSQQVNKLKF